MRAWISALRISSSALRAERIRLNTIASNLANIHTTRTPEGGPYMRKEVIFKAKPVDEKFWTEKNIYLRPLVFHLSYLPDFIRERITEKISETKIPVDSVLSEVEVEGIVEDPRPPVLKYEPYHPDADENGYVAYPNINPIEEMVNLISAQRAFEANVAAVNATREIANTALTIGQRT
ncbi:Flagellar basal-body rod protein FlgC [bacterium HR19]|nr:Flagellar basal-body rod protein FlgC [bacterium HR19]